MSKTLGGNVGLVTCFRGVGALGLAAEQSFSESDQMIQIFTEKCPDLFGCGTDLTPKFGAKRTSFLAKRAGSLAKSVGNIIDGFTEIAFAKRLIDLVKNLPRLAMGLRQCATHANGLRSLTGKLKDNFFAHANISA